MIEIFFDVSALCAFKGLQRNCILQDSYDWLCERLGVLSLSNFFKLKFKISDYHFSGCWIHVMTKLLKQIILFDIVLYACYCSL